MDKIWVFVIMDFGNVVTDCRKAYTPVASWYQHLLSFQAESVQFKPVKDEWFGELTPYDPSLGQAVLKVNIPRTPRQLKRFQTYLFTNHLLAHHPRVRNDMSTLLYLMRSKIKRDKTFPSFLKREPYNVVWVLPALAAKKKVLSLSELERLVCHELAHLWQYEHSFLERYPLSSEGIASFISLAYAETTDGQDSLGVLMNWCKDEEASLLGEEELNPYKLASVIGQRITSEVLLEHTAARDSQTQVSRAINILNQCGTIAEIDLRLNQDPRICSIIFAEENSKVRYCPHKI